jgi:hypothetical protein
VKTNTRRKLHLTGSVIGFIAVVYGGAYCMSWVTGWAELPTLLVWVFATVSMLAAIVANFIQWRVDCEED